MNGLDLTGQHPAPPIGAGDGRGFRETVERLSNQDIGRCYFCQKCSAGCPTALDMEYQPAQILKLVQLNMKEIVLNTSSIWLCVGCETCGTRCPNGIALAPVMDVLKQMAVAEGAVKPRKVLAFHRAFVNSILRLGRVHELSMLIEYKWRSRDLLSDMDLGVRMFLRSKLALWPGRVRQKREITEILSRFARREPGADSDTSPTEGS